MALRFSENDRGWIGSGAIMDGKSINERGGTVFFGVEQRATLCQR